jgi:serine/threonine protein kinase
MSLSVAALLRSNRMHVLNTESAKGFIIVIEEKYVLKFTLISEDNRDFPEINKFSTSLLEFQTEANEQQRAYALSKVCPPILCTLVLQNANALDYFWLISKRCRKNTDTYCSQIFEQLQEIYQLSPNLQCGIIVMPYAQGVSYKNTKTWEIKKRQQIIANCIKNVVNLYYKAARIHGDLHETNIIVDPVTLECKFIDFGVVEIVEPHASLPPQTPNAMAEFLNIMEPWLEFLSGDAVVYKSGLKRIYDPIFLQLCIQHKKTV